MEHFFTLPVTYNGSEHEYQGRLVTFGYSFKFYIIVDKRELVFEKDDERHLRALDMEEILAAPFDKELLVAIAVALEQIAQS